MKVVFYFIPPPIIMGVDVSDAVGPLFQVIQTSIPISKKLGMADVQGER